MVLRTATCPDCSAPVPAGRFACRECGALLAAVSGSVERGPAIGQHDRFPSAGEAPAPIAIRPAADAPAASANGPAGAGTPQASDTPSWLAAPAIDDRLIRRLTAAGAVIAALGFLLPWAGTVIGADGFGSWFDRWGLANPAHVPVLGLVLVALGLGAGELRLPTRARAPAWLRSGVLGLLLAGLLAGLAWPYLFGRLGPTVGVYVVTTGAVVLAGAAVLALRPSRHADGRSVV